MVNHIVMWNFIETLSEEEKKEAAAVIKERLEGLIDKIDGVISLNVATDVLNCGNRDLGLISSFESREALDAYQVHPAHLEAASYVRSVTKDRACLDYNE